MELKQINLAENNQDNSQHSYVGYLNGRRSEFLTKLDNYIQKNKITYLIFDYDGTLMDTLPSHYQAWHDAHLQNGYRFVANDIFVNRFSGISGHEMIKIISQETNQTIDIERVVIAKNKIFMSKYISFIKPIHKILEIVQFYSAEMPIALASGGHRNAIDIVLKNNNLSNLFDPIVTIEDVAQGKPSPDIFNKAAQLKNMQPQNCLVFEDTEAGFQAAINAGMKFINIHEITE
jgi:beta-phosphoglucomutase-like phosphatase (HAD superfamily)